MTTGPGTGRPMTRREQSEHAKDTAAVKQARRILHATRQHGLLADCEDICVAIARLDDWLSDNEGRWTA